MFPILPYLLKSSTILLILLIYYQLFLKKQTFFNLNRIYLLCALIFSVAIPFISIEINRSDFSNTPPTILSGYVNNLLDEVQIWGNQRGMQNTETHYSLNIFQIIYGIGVLFFSIRFLITLFKLHLFIHTNPQKRIRGLNIIKMPEGLPTFSFFNYLFINTTTLTRENKRKIFAHEKIHIQQHHSLDLCISEIVCIVNWFNPLVWLLKHAILENHEYIADQQVIRRFQTGSYLELLIQQTLKGAFSFTNYFSCSNLKKRTIMMTKKQSRKYRVINYVPALLLTGMLFYLFSCNTQTNPQEESSQTTKSISDTNVYVVVENMPKFSNNESIQEWIAQNVKYPYEAMTKNIQGKVYVTFIIDATGKVTKPKIARGVDSLLNAEALRVVGSMPDWTPGTQRGQKVNVSYTIPINFILSNNEENTPTADITPKPTTGEIFVVVEKMPQFAQGNAQEWLAKNVKYPVIAVENNISGKVYVQFVIEKDGSITDAKVVKSANPSLDGEALRVIKAMPKWIPGEQRGNPVRVSMTLAVTFRL